jgi:hypothetical protein
MAGSLAIHLLNCDQALPAILIMTRRYRSAFIAEQAICQLRII